MHTLYFLSPITTITSALYPLQRASYSANSDILIPKGYLTKKLPRNREGVSYSLFISYKNLAVLSFTPGPIVDVIVTLL